MEVILRPLRGSLKLFVSLFIIISYFAKAFYLRLVNLGTTRAQIIQRRRAYSRNSQFFCGLMVKLLNVEVHLVGEAVNESNFLLVSNHMGFVDIFMISSLFPALFVTSQEMRERPLLGSICELAGCIFVERRSRVKIMNELGNLIEALQEGFNVVLYPEATSSDGVTILPFKKTLMMGGPQAGKPIQPVCVNYIEVNGEPFSLKNRDSVCWYGSMSFVNAIWQSLCAKTLKAEIRFLEPIYGNAHSDRTEIAHRAYNLVHSAFRPAAGGVEAPEADDDDDGDDRDGSSVSGGNDGNDGEKRTNT